MTPGTLLCNPFSQHHGDFPHLISSCFSRTPIRDGSSLLAKLLVLYLPNPCNENELGYPKHVKDFATQDDLD